VYHPAKKGGHVTFGERLKMFRTLAGLSQNELAKQAGISRPLISALEAGKRHGMTVENARRLARALMITLDQLVGEPEPASLDLVGAER
jgi:transcriptional regulator with XRE-family HTH domain